MGRYIQWDDAIDRYPELNTLAGADEMASAYIVYAETFTEGMLANKYTVPFSSNNMTVKDLCIDYTYWMAARFKLEDAVSIRSSYLESIMLLNKGSLAMIDVNGSIISDVKKNIGIYSSTQSYHSAFGMTTDEEWHIDENNIDDDRNLD